jgi:hypothetical protein
MTHVPLSFHILWCLSSCSYTHSTRVGSPIRRVFVRCPVFKAVMCYIVLVTGCNFSVHTLFVDLMTPSNLYVHRLNMKCLQKRVSCFFTFTRCPEQRVGTFKLCHIFSYYSQTILNLRGHVQPVLSVFVHAS